MGAKVLIVDDDVNLLSGLRRNLRTRFDMLTAAGGAEALEQIALNREIAVVVSDMRMPGMTGLELLSRLAETQPMIVRIMLTGNNDQQTAIDAINAGHILRFLHKPCSIETLTAAIDAGLSWHDTIMAEKTLLEQTLAGSVKLLVDLLSVMEPDAFGKTARLREWIGHLAGIRRIANRWELDLAAMLSPIGDILIPEMVRDKHGRGEALSSAEADLVLRSKDIAAELIRNIPRLAPAAEAIRLMGRGFDGSGHPVDGPAGHDIPEHARILRVLDDLVEIADGGAPTAEVFHTLEENRSRYDADILADIKKALLPISFGVGESSEWERLNLPISSLRVGDMPINDIETIEGRLMLGAGASITEYQLHRLWNLRKVMQFREPLDVARPRPRRDVA